MAKQKKKRPPRQRYFRWFLISFAAFLLAATGIYYLVRYIYRVRNPIYEGFQITLPSGYDVHGIDVSRYQKSIEWKSVKEMESRGVQLQFAFIKATEGTDMIDPQYRRNWKYAKDNGLARGAYHFFRPKGNAAKQAENFLQIVKPEAGDLPPVLDIEVTEGQSKLAIIKAVQTWLTIVEGRLKVKPIIYTNASFYQQYFDTLFDAYPLWVAHYFAPDGPRIKRQWQFWQHSERGRVNGIDAYVDFNVFSGSRSKFEALLIKEEED